MAGLFGLFGKKTKYVDEPTPPQPVQEPKEAFFLEPDAAKTLGDVEFIENPKVIKRSFPKTLKGGGGKTVKSISSMEITEVNGNRPSNPQVESAVETNGESGDRKRNDSSLDIFRQMAKDLKK